MNEMKVIPNGSIMRKEMSEKLTLNQLSFSLSLSQGLSFNCFSTRKLNLKAANWFDSLILSLLPLLQPTLVLRNSPGKVSGGSFQAMQ